MAVQLVDTLKIETVSAAHMRHSERNSNMHHDFETGRHVGPTSGQVQAQAARSVALLNAIEGTITRLVSDTEITYTLVRESRLFLESLKSSERTELLDPEGRACDLFKQGSAASLRLYNKCIDKRNAARTATELSSEDGVAEAYTGFIAALADLHNVLEDIRDTMATLDAELSPVVGVAASHAELLALLKA